MNSARFLWVLRVEQEGNEVHMVANIVVGELKCQALLVIPYEGPEQASKMTRYMTEVVSAEQDVPCRPCLRLLKGGKSGA